MTGQRLMQATSDIFLGSTKGYQADRYLYWRQLRDMKGSAVVEQMNPAGMTYYARLCGWTLARAHARSGDAVAIAAYLGEDDHFDVAIADFARRYAEQNERDYAAFTEAINTSRLARCRVTRAGPVADDDDRLPVSAHVRRAARQTAGRPDDAVSTSANLVVALPVPRLERRGGRLAGAVHGRRWSGERHDRVHRGVLVLPRPCSLMFASVSHSWW